MRAMNLSWGIMPMQFAPLQRQAALRTAHMVMKAPLMPRRINLDIDTPAIRFC